MRASWLVLVMVVGCGEAYEIHVTASATGGQAQIVEAGCDCVPEIRLEVGDCYNWSDVGSWCACERVCEDPHARVVADGVTLYDAATAFFRSAPGARLSFTACGETFDIALPRDFPEPPTIVAADGDQRPSTVEWITGAGTASLLVAVGNGFAGQRCRVPADTSRKVLDGDGELTVVAEGITRAGTTGDARTYVRPVTRAANP